MTVTGYRYVPHDDKDSCDVIPAVKSAKAMAKAAPYLYELAACDKCKHRLTCLVEPEAARLFESK